ncbi:MAG: DNA repair protein RecO [Candidatus Cloacimonetes bacterium]|nr:DNA repair protein RecO [Candidatus Cloacimonadota bacterium]
MSSRIEKCNAFALRITNYSNTSQIINFFSDKFGHIDVIAKGSRSSKSKQQGLLQPMSNYEIIIYKKENSLSLLKEISLIESNLELFTELEKSAATYAAGEIYLQLMFEKNDYEKFYNLLQKYLSYLKKIRQNHILIFWRFLLRVLIFLGFPMNLEKCAICDETNHKKIYGISFSKNGLICKNCIQKNGSSNKFKCTKSGLEILFSLKNISAKIDSIKISKSAKKEINEIFKTYLTYHFHKNIYLKSFDIL